MPSMRSSVISTLLPAFPDVEAMTEWGADGAEVPPWPAARVSGGARADFVEASDEARCAVEHEHY